MYALTADWSFAFRFDPSSGFIPWSSFTIHYADNWPGDIDDDEYRIEESIAELDERRVQNVAKSDARADKQQT